MAPFNTHFLLAERLWPELQNDLWQAHYGQFCFGCIAPDVDKVSPMLSQKDTHFFDRTDNYEAMASRRTAAFLARQDSFLGRPFHQLSGEGQAFVLGYLCHLCLDEVSKHMWRRDTWLQFQHVRPTSAFAALDELAWHHTQNYAAVAGALCAIEVLDIISPIPVADLQGMHRGVCTFVQSKSAEEEYLALEDLFSNPTPEQRCEYRRWFRAEIDLARAQVHIFELENLIEAGMIWSRQRLAALIEGRLLEPAYPELR